MDVNRAEKIAAELKTITQLGKNSKKSMASSAHSAHSAHSAPSVKVSQPKLQILNPTGAEALPTPVEGSWFLRILMYSIAGILLVILLLLAVDQWITPIFQRSPGGKGYIPIPGTDLTEVYWKTIKDVDNIMVGTPVEQSSTSSTPSTPKLSTTGIVGQSDYSITMDVFINDEYSQTVGIKQRRIFFLLGQTPTTPTLIAWLDNHKNTAYVTAFDSKGQEESVEIENVPIHKPFRIGIVKSTGTLEGYLNGMLVKTRQLRSVDKSPIHGDLLFAPANIIVDGNVLSKNIQVLNMRIFGYVATPGEMRGRMNDLISKSVFKPPPTTLANSANSPISFF